MTTLRNGGEETVYFRDDAGKHDVEPGATLELTGEQHLPAALDAGLDVALEEPETAGETEPAPAPTRIRAARPGRDHGATAEPESEPES